MATSVTMDSGAALHPPSLTEEEVAQFQEQGYLRLGQVVPPEAIEGLAQRIDDIMMGDPKHSHLNMMMSVCPSETGSWTHPATQQTIGFKYPTLGYRKIQDLEQDDVFRNYVSACARAGPLL
eukprot:SAG22_NODE_198_length_15480_cov_24.005526_2_plen_122_part_00